MKKLLVILVVISLLIIGYSYDQFLWCKKLFLSEPATHVIQKGEYLSKIALKYYGRADYWRELAIINRAPVSDAVFPGEEIIIPSKDVIMKIRKTRWLSRVNEFVKDQEEILAQLAKPADDNLASEITPESQPAVSASQLEQIPVETKTTDQNPKTVRSSLLTIILAAVAVLFIGALITLMIYHRKKQKEEISIVDDINLNFGDDKEESEPDYQEYLSNKKRKRREALIS